jgi:hypothetical protein
VTVIPADPLDAVRDRYRELECEERPGDPWLVEFDPAREPFRIIPHVPAFLVALLVIAIVWRVLLWL